MFHKNTDEAINKQNLFSDCKSYIYKSMEENLKNQQPDTHTMRESAVKFTKESDY